MNRLLLEYHYGKIIFNPALFSILITCLSVDSSEISYDQGHLVLRNFGGKTSVQYQYDESGNRVSVALDAALSVDGQSQNTTASFEAQSSLNVEVTGFPFPDYRWQFSEDGKIWQNIEDGSIFSDTITEQLEILASKLEYDGWYFRCVASNGQETVFSDSVQLFVRNPLETWMYQKFGLDLGYNSDYYSEDTDADGLPNLLEYALGENPNAPGNTKSHLAVKPKKATQGNFEISFPTIEDPFLTYEIQGSSDLINWQTVWTQTGDANTETTIQVTLKEMDVSASQFKFFRVSVKPYQ